VKPFLLLLLLFVPLALLAQPKPPVKDAPVVQYSSPLFVTPTAKVTVVLRGQKLDTATEVKSGDARVTAKLVGKGKKATVPANYTANKLGDTECEIELTFPKEFTPEQVALTVTNPAGTSELYNLVVVAKPTVEIEPNDSFAQAQPITLPVTIEGTISKERDVDVFKFEGKKGQQVTFEIVAARLGAPTDALITLYDATQGVVGIVDDTGDSTDPIFKCTLPRDGTFFITVIEAADLGGPQFGYRLKGR
jgi:Bacterial pre-peptidase C-terminal domain